MKKILLIAMTLCCGVSFGQLNENYHSLSSGAFTQDWSSGSLISSNDDWSNVPSITGFNGGDLSSGSVQTITGSSSIIDVIEGSSSFSSSGGVHEIDGEVIALQGSGSADAPHIVIRLNAVGVTDVRVKYSLKELDIQDATQEVALQYRKNDSDSWTDVSAGYISDAADGTNKVTPVDVTLPSDADGAATLQIRVITDNASGGDSMIGIDDIDISGTILSVQTVGFDLTTGTETETNSSFNTTIPVSLTNYGGSQVDLSVSVSGGSAESGDYTLNTTSLSFTNNATQNISIDINADADIDNETIEITLAETTSTGITVNPATHTITVTDDDIPNLIISEIMYNTPSASVDDEWIEVYNANGGTVDVSGWTIESNGTLEFTFPSSTSLPDGSYTTIALGSNGSGTFNDDNPFTPDFAHDDIVSDVDNSTVSNVLSNTSRTITVKTDGGAIVDEVFYDDGDDNRTDGDGPSYEIVDLASDNSNTSSNWQASVADGGSPGAVSAVTIWSGSTDTDWGTAGNWSNGLPSASLNAVIPDVSAGSNNSPSLSGSSAVNDLDIASGVIVTLTSEASLIINDQTIGSGQVTVNKTTPHGASDGQYSIIGSPVESAMTNVLGSIVYSYDESFDYGANGNGRFSLVTVAETMSPGDAYFSANTGDITFTGIPNTGTITQTLVYDEIGDGSAANAGFNLVSNPYTAAIDVDLLVAGNDDIDASIYLWQDESSNTTQGSNNDYVVYNSELNESTRTTAGGKTFDGFLRSAQGFFVKATDATSVSFTPTMMSTGNNGDAGFFRTEKAVTDLVRLSISNGELYSDAIIALRDDATEGVDRLYDAYSFAGSALNIYSFIGNDKFAIQGLPNAGSKTIIDLGFRAELEGELTIKLEEGKFEGYQVYLLDTELEEMVDLSSVESYSFETGQVSNSKRFQLVLSVNEVLSFDSNIDKADFTVYASSSTLSIRTLEAFETANIKVFSIDGSSILEVNDVNLSEKAWNTSFNKTGIFIMTIETPNGLLVKKFLN